MWRVETTTGDTIEASLRADTRNAWRLEPDGSWAQEDPSRTEAISSFTLAKEAAAETR